MKYILHIDMNAFFASVEEILNPELANKPIAVGGKTTRSVIASANYLARAKGVKAAMPIFQARKKCKNLIIVLCHFEEYEKYSELFMNLIKQNITNQIQPMSIDECYVDITNLVHSPSEAIHLAKKIQILIYQKLNLKCSIGVSYNLFLAKMASDLKKPMGITSIFTKQDLQTKIWPLNIQDMYLIGTSTAKALKANGINTIQDLANENNKQILSSILNKNWYIHFLHANGLGNDKLDYSKAIPKSLSNSKTFLIDTNNTNEIKHMMSQLTEELIDRLHEHNLSAKTIQVVIKYPNFKNASKHITLKKYINKYSDVFNTAWNIYTDNFYQQNIRLIGIGLSNLKETLNLENTLFDNSEIKTFKENDLYKIIKNVNQEMKLDLIDIASKKLIKK